jgi:hypothetical protein
MDDKEKYLRWLEEMWDLHNNITREEKPTLDPSSAPSASPSPSGDKS